MGHIVPKIWTKPGKNPEDKSTKVCVCCGAADCSSQISLEVIESDAGLLLTARVLSPVRHISSCSCARFKHNKRENMAKLNKMVQLQIRVDRSCIKPIVNINLNLCMQWFRHIFVGSVDGWMVVCGGML